MACRVVRPVKSGPSRRACYLRFINRTSRRVNLFWIDYGGYGVNYGTLEPDRHFDIHSYEGHPWMAEDARLRTPLLLNNSRIFYPSAIDHDNANVQPNREFRNYLPLLINQGNRNNQNEVHLMRRQVVLITIPVLSLQDRCAEVINSSLRNRNDVYALDLPTKMQNMLFEGTPGE